MGFQVVLEDGRLYHKTPEADGEGYRTVRLVCSVCKVHKVHKVQKDGSVCWVNRQKTPPRAPILEVGLCNVLQSGRLYHKTPETDLARRLNRLEALRTVEFRYAPETDGRNGPDHRHHPRPGLEPALRESDPGLMVGRPVAVSEIDRSQ